MSFDPDEVKAILKTTVQEIGKQYIGMPLSPLRVEELRERLTTQVGEILGKFSYLGGFEIDKNDIHIFIDPRSSSCKIMLGGETAKKFVGELP